MVKSPSPSCKDIYIEMRRCRRAFSTAERHAARNPEVVKSQVTGTKWLQEMEELVGKKPSSVKPDPSPTRAVRPFT